MTIQELIDKLIDKDYPVNNYLGEQENFNNHIIYTVYEYFKNELKILDTIHIGCLFDLELSNEISKIKQ